MSNVYCPMCGKLIQVPMEVTSVGIIQRDESRELVFNCAHVFGEDFMDELIDVAEDKMIDMIRVIVANSEA